MAQASGHRKHTHTFFQKSVGMERTGLSEGEAMEGRYWLPRSVEQTAPSLGCRVGLDGSTGNNHLKIRIALATGATEYSRSKDNVPHKSQKLG